MFVTDSKVDCCCEC